MNQRPSTEAALAALYTERPRRNFVIWSVRLFGLIITASWILGDFHLQSFFSQRRLDNVQRFFSEIRPWPLQQSDLGWNQAWPVVKQWAWQLWLDTGAEAFGVTLAVSLVAIVLAAVLGALLSLPAAQNLACPKPFLAGGKPPSSFSIIVWRMVVGVTRLVLVFVRSVPEYVWAFLLLALLGPNFWPLILALVLHNTGILGKLGAEVIENTDQSAPGALRAAGAGRLQIALAVIFPLSLPRFLLYFFYRWETCVREATVLGMLGIGSLGFWMMESRARNRYDELVYYILVGVLLVLAGDLLSALARRVIRRA